MSILKANIERIILPEIHAMNIDLVDIEMSSLKGKTLIRLFVDRLGETAPKCTINVGDCEQVSRAVLRLFDVEDIFNGANYMLEVSTPGLDRTLKKIEDFIRFKSCLVKVTLNNEIDKQGFFEGRIVDVRNNDTVVLDINKKEQLIEYKNIKKAKLKYEG